jgi:hypothetical protein
LLINLIIPHIPKMGIWGIFNLSGKVVDNPAHAGLNRIGKAVFVIPPLCSQKHTHKGKTSSLKKISRLRYASACIFSAALVATASTLIPALR